MTADSLPLLKRKVAVLGTATTTLEQAPVNDPDWEIWTCSPWMQGRMAPRSETQGGFDRFFEIHFDNQFYPSEREHFVPWLGTCGKPVYVFDDLGLPNQVMYPRAAIERLHGSAFFTSTIAWMLALAIDHGPEAIGIWGVDMADGTEYAYQKQGCLHFIALARLLGIKVVIPAQSELHRVPAPYPDRYATETARVLRGRLDEAEAGLKAIDAALGQVEASRLNMRMERHARQAEIETLRALVRVLV